MNNPEESLVALRSAQEPRMTTPHGSSLRCGLPRDPG